MAVTFTASNLLRDVSAKSIVMGTLTCSGTTTDNGDLLSPSTIGLGEILQLIPSNTLDSTSNPEGSFVVVWNKVDGKISFFSQAVAGATTPLAAITDGTSITHSFQFIAFGK
jgi:hypothetical protein